MYNKGEAQKKCKQERGVRTTPPPPAEESASPESAGESSAFSVDPESQSEENESTGGERYVNGLDMTDPDNHPEIPTPV